MNQLKKWFHNLFVPHPGNDHSPHFWRDRSVGILLAVVLLAELAVFAQSFIVLRKDSYLAAVLPAVLTSLTNGQRIAYDLNPVKENPLLVEAAQMKANDMAKRQYFSHNTPEGKLPWYWLDQVGYKYDEAGENLAVNFFDSQDVVDAWMKSPTHKANIVKGSYTEIGIAMADGIYQGHPAVYVAQFFGKPKTATAVASASSSTPAASPVASTDATVLKKPASASVRATTTRAVVASPAASTPGSSSSTPAIEPPSEPEASTTGVIALVASSSSPSSTAPLVAGAEIDTDAKASAFAAFASSPRHVAIYVLATILIIILAAYLIMVFVTRRVHHPRMLMLTIAFILIIAGLLVFNSKFLKDRMEVGNGQSTFVSTDMTAAAPIQGADVNAANSAQH